MLLAAMLAMVVVAAVPALGLPRFHHGGGVNQDTEQEVESGDSEQSINVTGGGDNSNACQGVQGINNTGNSVNSTNLLQYASLGDIEVEDTGSFEISPSQT